MLTEQIETLFCRRWPRKRVIPLHTIRAYGHDLAEFAAYAADGQSGKRKQAAG
jgi:hypothetical protein